MKSLEELKMIRDRVRAELIIREEKPDSTKILVNMAACGIAAGAKLVLNAFVEEISKRGLKNVMVTQADCIGKCQYEPTVEVIIPGQEKVIYVEMTPEKAVRVVNEHIINNNVIDEFTIDAKI